MTSADHEMSTSGRHEHVFEERVLVSAKGDLLNGKGGKSVTGC